MANSRADDAVGKLRGDGLASLCLTVGAQQATFSISGNGKSEAQDAFGMGHLQRFFSKLEALALTADAEFCPLLEALGQETLLLTLTFEQRKGIDAKLSGHFEEQQMLLMRESIGRAFEATGKRVELGLPTLQITCRLLYETHFQVFHLFELMLHLVDEILCDGCGSLEMGVCDVVDDGFVALMANTCDDGERELCDVGSQEICVEAIQVRHGTSAADDDDAIPLLHLVGYLIQGIDDAAFDLDALHGGREEMNGKAEAAFLELMAEIAVPRSPCCRNDGNALKRAWKRELLVQM